MVLEEQCYYKCFVWDILWQIRKIKSPLGRRSAESRFGMSGELVSMYLMAFF